jgi:hypothetical protein
MSYQNLKKKLLFYSLWWCEMSAEERKGFTGKWVRERIEIFDGILKEIEKHIEQFQRLIKRA